MDILLNLLPPPKKKFLNHIYLVLYLRILIEILLFYGVIVAITLVLANYYLKSNLDSVQLRTVSSTQVYEQMNKEIKIVNRQMFNIAAAQKNWRAWTPYLAELFQNTSSTVSLGGLNFNKENKQLILQGIAKTRADVLQFKEKLQGLSWLEKFEVPAETLTVKENVEFSFSIPLKLP